MTKITFKYSLFEDIKMLFRIYLKPSDYAMLISVVWNPLSVVKGYFHKRKNIKFIEDEWGKVEVTITDVLSKIEILRDTPVDCYVVSCGPEGMFNPHKNSIHSRFDGANTFPNFVETLIHELIHLELYDPKTYDYEKGEEEVENVMNKKEIQDLLKNLE